MLHVEARGAAAEDQSMLNILLVGSGDLRHVLTTLASTTRPIHVSCPFYPPLIFHPLPSLTSYLPSLTISHPLSSTPYHLSPFILHPYLLSYPPLMLHPYHLTFSLPSLYPPLILHPYHLSSPTSNPLSLPSLFTHLLSFLTLILYPLPFHPPYLYTFLFFLYLFLSLPLHSFPLTLPAPPAAY